MYICNVFAFRITVNTSTRSPCQGIPWISPEEVLCAYTWLQVSWYFLHSTWYTLKLEKLTQNTRICILATKNVQSDLWLMGLMVVVYTWIFARSLHDSPRCWAPITSTLLPNAWTCTDPLPEGGSKWNKAVRHHTYRWTWHRWNYRCH